MKRTQQEKYIREQNFEDLFIEQGWDEARDPAFDLKDRDGNIIEVQARFQKKGFAVCFCNDERVLSMNPTDRTYLLRRLGRHHYEHLLIAYGKDGDGINAQHWMVSIRPQDRPLRVAMVQWRDGQDLQGLIEKLEGLIFPLAEEESLTIVDVVERVRFAFSTNTEKITKGFYRQFKAELDCFDGFISGIQKCIDRKKYAALMLNRLMFIYFIQKKGFLNGETDYLQKRLQKTQKQYGNDQFFDKFYRGFLRRLFHEGLDTPAEERSAEINQLLGKVPYLNGGLFDSHTLEIENDTIAIPDDAFKKLFDFFDRYNWHLDARPTASGRDINPEVLGYIFEKYINDRAQMGAYYTQEDITGYIARNTVLPFLLRHTREHCKNAFEPSGIWWLLKQNPDDYIYAAVKHGCDMPDEQIPEDIRRGIAVDQPQLRQRRQNWNTPAPQAFGLPTETWREVIARRVRCAELRQKLKDGAIQSADDLITYNLDIIRFVGDAIQEYEGADFIAALFRAIAGVRQQWKLVPHEKSKRGISVLDPACGSGAFLFAALNVLEPLYEGCIDRMEAFVAADDAQVKAGKSKKYLLFRKVLQEIKQHQNRRYWIFKTIILENLYGVDLMAEAVEIAKLRLFLKLAAEAKYDPNKKNLGLEPLPDIDYNIRCGNSLVGFASMEQFERFASARLHYRLLETVREQAKMIQLANDHFCRMQNKGDGSYVTAKRALADELAKLNETLNPTLAHDYGIGTGNPQRYKKWKESHQPFHWFANFYGIIKENGGFDVVIGNPPYVKYSEARKSYTTTDYITEKCNNLYAMFIERINTLTKNHIGMIVQLPLVCTDAMKPAQDILRHFSVWFLNFDDRPGKLFSDMQHIRACIFITSLRNKRMDNSNIHTTNYKRWHSHTRSTVFKNINFINHDTIKEYAGSVPKIGDNLSKAIYQKVNAMGNVLGAYLYGYHLCYFHNAPQYWIRATDFIPYFWNERDGEKQSIQVKNLKTKKQEVLSLCALINSTLFYWWFIVLSDCRHLNLREINNFPINLTEITKNNYFNLSEVNKKLMLDYRQHAIREKKTYKTTGAVVYDEFHPSHSKEIIDEIDVILAEHYSFTEEELDYIINYDYKYRMGKKQ